MKLTFVGADHEVTGSCHCIQVGNKRILVDFGMEQGINVFENAPLPFDEAMSYYVFLTHARTFALSCFATVHTSRCRRRNGNSAR